MNQILTFSAIRDVIDERMEKIKQTKVDMRNLNGNDRRREQEALQKWVHCYIFMECVTQWTIFLVCYLEVYCSLWLIYFSLDTWTFHDRVKDGEWTAEQLEKEKDLLYRRKQDQARRLRELNEENLLNQVRVVIYSLLRSETNWMKWIEGKLMFFCRTKERYLTSSFSRLLHK